MGITLSQFDDPILLNISLLLLFFFSIEILKQSSLDLYDSIFAAFSFFLMLLTFSLF